MSNFDTLLTSVGEFGPYQKRLCFLVFVLAIPNGILITSVVFNNVTPDYRCAVPGLTNDSYAIQGPHHQSLVQDYIPMDEDGEHYSHCKTYALDGTQGGPDNNKTRECDGWVFDESDKVVSQIVEFKLVCDRALYKAHNNLMVLLGLLVGSLIGGSLSDFFGRKKTTLAGLVLSCALAAAMAAVQSFLLVMLCRFLVIVCSVTVFLAPYVLLIETVGVNRRSIASISSMMGYTAGLFVLTLIQYAFRDWRIAQLFISLPLLALAFIWWFLPESPRWLLTKNRQTEARAVLANIAKVNKTSLPQEMDLADDIAMTKSNDADKDVTTDLKIWHLCTSRRYVFYIIILCFSWVTLNMVYYGLVLGVGDLIEGDIYVNFLLQSSMEVISHAMCVFVLENLDRKKIYCSSMITTGVSVLGIGVLVLADKDIRWLSIAFYCLGKLCITIGFNLIYIITTELLPTRIRNSGLGFCSCVARFSGIVSPYIISASLLIPGPFGKALPVLIFGVLSLTSGLSAILLPETRNRELPETLDNRSSDPIET